MSARKARGGEAAKSKTGGRKRRISPADLHRAMKTLGDQTAELAALARQMEEHALREIEIDGLGLLKRGNDEIDRYIDNVSKGIGKARRQKERSAL